MQGTSEITQESTQNYPLWLLELPAEVLPFVLQQLDQCSLASTAATCSRLSHAVPAHLSTLEVCCKSSEAFASFNKWLQHNSPSLTKLEQWSVKVEPDNLTQLSSSARNFWFTFKLPSQLPQLLQLHLRNLLVQLGPFESDGRSCPGVLQQCSGLTSLDLEACEIGPPSTATAAIAALPGLKSLRLASSISTAGYIPVGELLTKLQHASQLTHLSLDFKGALQLEVRMTSSWTPAELAHLEEMKQLSQLSALTSLQHLDLGYIPSTGLQGNLPSQLVNLTSLRVSHEFMYASNSIPTSEQFQHLSALTALQELSITSTAVPGPRHNYGGGRFQSQPSSLPGLASLSHLTSLEMEPDALGLQFSTGSAESWSRLTALQRLTLHDGTVQPDALAAFTQLRALRLDGVVPPAGQQLKDLFNAVTQLSLLTELLVSASEATSSRSVDPPTAAAFTALTASTNLRSLQVGFVGRDAAPCVLFKSGIVYPSMRLIDLRYAGALAAPMSEQQLQQLCSCCPNLESLVFTMCEVCSPTALQPLLQLSALTRLEVYPNRSFTINLDDFRSQLAMQSDEKATASTAAAAAAAAAGIGAGAVRVAAQLTGLKHLAMQFKESPRLTDAVLMQLTMLTALEKLRLRCYREYDYDPHRDVLSLQNKARPGKNPDVWTQLARHLERSTAAAAASPAGPQLPGRNRAFAAFARGNSSSGPDRDAREALMALLRARVANTVSVEPPLHNN